MHRSVAPADGCRHSIQNILGPAASRPVVPKKTQKIHLEPCGCLGDVGGADGVRAQLYPPFFLLFFTAIWVVVCLYSLVGVDSSALICCTTTRYWSQSISWCQQTVAWQVAQTVSRDVISVAVANELAHVCADAVLPR